MTKWSPPDDRCRCGNPIRWLDRYCNNCAEREADRVFSLWIRKRDGVCVVPDCRNPRTDAAHILTRDHRRVRYDERNVVSLCSGPAGHHRYFHAHPRELPVFVEMTWPGRMAALNLASRSEQRPDYGEIIRRYGRKVA